MVGDPPGVAVGGPHDRRGPLTIAGVGRRQGPRHPVRAGRDGPDPNPRRGRTFARSVVAVRAAAGPSGPHLPLVGHPGWDQRDPPHGHRQGPAMTDQLLIDTAEKAFGDTATFEAVQEAERDGWAPRVWE